MDDDLGEQLAKVRERIGRAAERGGRDPASVLLVAVTKTVPLEAITRAYAIGLRDFGENRVQEAREKRSVLSLSEARWELIGHLQSNKAARAVQLFDRVQSLDSVALACTLDERAASHDKVLPVLLEVNVAGEQSKSGFAPRDLLDAAHAIAALDHLRPEGLMTVAPLAPEAEAVRPVFRELRRLRDHLRAAVPLAEDGGWPQLSMGMSDDFEIAIEEGATIIRLGRAIFGARPTP
jgi:pyridoxal phosphate enzyme (YggS family)